MTLSLPCSLEKIDILRARLGVGYKEARKALEEADGDVVQALVAFEERGLGLGERLQAMSLEAVEQLKAIMHKSQDYKIKLKKDDATVLEVPASVGALGLIGALSSRELAVVGALSAVIAMANNYSWEFAREDMVPYDL
jgi:NACalpha-BTF3-like transcription factor